MDSSFHKYIRIYAREWVLETSVHLSQLSHPPYFSPCHLRRDNGGITDNYGFLTGLYATFTMLLLWDYYMISMWFISLAYPFAILSATSAICRFRLFPLVVFFREKFFRTESCAEDINSFWISSILFWLQSYKIFCRCASVNRQSRTSTAETNCTTYYALFCLFCTTKCAFLIFFCTAQCAFNPCL